MRLGRRTYKVKCPDGTTRIVHRNVDDAFPLAIKEGSGRLSAMVKDLAGNSVGIDGEFRRGVSNLLYQLNERNASAMINFRATYVAFQANPCKQADRLARRIEQMTTEQQELAKTRQELSGVIDLAASAPGDPERIWEIFADIVTNSGLPGVPQASSARMREAHDAAKDWIGKKQ